MVVFTSHECDYLKSFYDREVEHTADDIQDYGKLKIKFSNSSVNYIESKHPELINFLVKKLKKYGVKSIPQVKFLKYKTGDNLARHTDFSKYGTDVIYKTYLFQLSDSSEYTGGELIVGNDIQTKDKGSMFIINPTTPHEVKKITSGERISMTLFLLEDNLNLDKSLI